MKIMYVVFGETGEYSDWTSWPVAIHHTKEDAETHAGLATAAVDAHLKDEDTYSTYDVRNPYDHNARHDYTGTRYTVQEIPFPSALADYVKAYTPEAD